MLQLDNCVTTSHLDILSTRIHWFIQMRWIFITILLLFCCVAGLFYPVIDVEKFLALGFFLVALNVVYLVIDKRTKKRYSSSTQIYVFIGTQFVFDYIVLSLFLYYSGGVANPLIYIFLFNVIISCLLLPNALVLAITFSSIVFFLALAFMSQFGIIPYYPFPLVWQGIIIPKPSNVLFLIEAGCFVLVIAVMLYFVANITALLRKREELLRGTINELKMMEDVRMKTMMHVAHDLKAPLAAAQSSIKSVADGFVGPISEKVRSILFNAYRRCHNMTAMVKDMFDLIRFDEQIMRGELIAERFSLGALMDNVKEQFDSPYHGKSIQWDIKIDGTIEINANVGQIGALLSQLVSNAIKYSGDPVNISISAEKSGDDLILVVNDDGVGISVEERERVLDEFYRTVKAKKMEKDGVGLGLAIVQKIVKFYNGKISIDDGPEKKGTTFTILLSNVMDVRGPQAFVGTDLERAARRRFFEPCEESPKEIENKW
ncbi:MAG: hypothetical protein COV46_01750 [Deltaproteobacteria bacterium CG11_big_fil_rev_8_21_14_0_20_49_13]|nr:MAG: hypothetical protein COV46_01750 [Deltaproteobacteria bacterium CG11_big_fil_rev_8_21_14_0_20_49_13]